jgi:phosphonoacetaldehyde hydrolase
MIKAVIFDWAGTTIDFGCMAPAGAFVEAFAHVGVPVTLAEARRPMGYHKKDHLRVMLQAPDLAARWQAKHGQPWTEADVLRLYELVTPLQLEAVKQHSTLIPGTLECINALRLQSIAIGATTGYFTAAADVCYQLSAEQGYTPDFTICADDVPAGRPKPWMIYRCMEALSVYPPKCVVKVGDTVVDIEDGLNAGVWSVAVVDSSNEMGLTLAEFQQQSESELIARRRTVATKFQQAGAHAVVRSVAQVPELVAQLNKFLSDGITPDDVSRQLKS